MNTRHVFATFAPILLGACSSDLASAPIASPAAVVTVVFIGKPADTLKVLVTDHATIESAETFVRTGAGAHMITGTIVRGSGADARYPFHFVPESVRLADVGMEICDGEPMRTTNDVDLFFGWSTGSATSDHATWCPWASKPIAVEHYVVGTLR